MHAIQLIDLVFICNNNQLVLVHPLCHLIYEKYYPKFLKHRAHIMYALLQNVKLCAADVASFQIIFPYKFNCWGLLFPHCARSPFQTLTDA